jgi:hypothetical protein
MVVRNSLSLLQRVKLAVDNGRVPLRKTLAIWRSVYLEVTQPLRSCLAREEKPIKTWPFANDINQWCVVPARRNLWQRYAGSALALIKTTCGQPQLTAIGHCEVEVDRVGVFHQSSFSVKAFGTVMHLQADVLFGMVKATQD